MARFKVKGLDRARRAVDRLFEETTFSRSFLKTQAEFMLERIRAFTRSGKSIAGRRPVGLKGLKQSTIEDRRRAQARGEVDSEFFRAPDFSNLTRTGQLLRSLKAEVKGRRIDVFASGERKDGKANEEVAERVADAGRPFIGLDDVGIKQIKREAVRAIRQRLRRRKK